MLGHFKTISLILAVNVAVGGTFAVAQNAIADRSASYKADMARSHDVTGITFDVNDTDPSFVDAISFNLAPGYGPTKANQVEIQTRKNGPWTECSLANDVLPARVTCTFQSLAAEDVMDLNIVVK